MEKYLRKFTKNLKQLLGKFHIQLFELRRTWKRLSKHARQTCRVEWSKAKKNSKYHFSALSSPCTPPTYYTYTLLLFALLSSLCTLHYKCTLTRLCDNLLKSFVGFSAGFLIKEFGLLSECLLKSANQIPLFYENRCFDKH